MDCTEVECTVPGIYDHDVERTLALLISYDGDDEEDVALVTEDGIIVLL